MREVARIVKDTAKHHEIVVVTSAMSKVTDLLVSSAMNASRRQADALEQDLAKLRRMHLEAARELGAPTAPIEERLEALQEAFSPAYLPWASSLLVPWISSFRTENA